MLTTWLRRARPSLIAVPLLLAGCAAEPSSAPPSSERPAPTGTVVAVERVGGRDRLAGFDEVTVTVVDAEGRSHTYCMLLASTPKQDERGLMEVTDPALGGYAGMVFSYDHDTDDAFWMRHTRLPLSIVWVRADGSTVSTTDMTPCPDSQADCPVYPSGGDYRFAIEVPQGRLDDLGISDRSRVTLGDRSCAPV